MLESVLLRTLSYFIWNSKINVNEIRDDFCGEQANSVRKANYHKPARKESSQPVKHIYDSKYGKLNQEAIAILSHHKQGLLGKLFYSQEDWKHVLCNNHTFVQE